MRATRTACSRRRSTVKCWASSCAASASGVPRWRREGTDSLPAFAGYGIELEYAIVDARSLDIRPLAAPLLRPMGGARRAPVDGSAIDRSNGPVHHVGGRKN